MTVTSRIQQEGFKPEIYEQSGVRNKPAGLAEFIRDMRRLENLRKQYISDGLNSFESKEARELQEKYEISHKSWYQGEFRDE
jgi:hypothetical protein